MVDRSLTFYEGEDLSPSWDVTDLVKWEEAEFGTRAWRGESTNTDIPFRDEQSRTSHADNLPAGLQKIVFQARNTLEFVHGSNVLWRGRIANQSYTRGAQKAGRAREGAAYLEDINIDLRGIVVHGWSRPAETDVARLHGLIASYLSGSPRRSTIVNGSNLINAGSNVITLPAKVYNQTDPRSVIEDVATQANKTYYLLPRRRTTDAHTAELYYDGNDAVMELCPFRISDHPDEVKAQPDTVFAPIWNVGAAGELTAQETLSGVWLFYGQESYVHVADSGVADITAHWEEVIYDDTVTTEAEATSKANAIIQFRRSSTRRINVTIGPMGDQHIDSIRAGQRITIQAMAVPWADDQRYDANIGQLKITTPLPGIYFAHLELERPLRMGPYGAGDRGSTNAPNPPTESTGETVTPYESWDWDSGEEHVANVYAPDLPGPIQMLSQDGTSGPDDGAGGTSFSGGFGVSNISGGRVACTAGTTYRFFGYLWLFGESWPATDHGRVNGSWGVTWYDSGDSALRTDVIGSYANQAQDGPWLGPDEIDLVAPTGAVYFRMRSAIDPLLATQPFNTHIDQVTISVVGAPGTTGTTPPSLGGPGEGSFGTPGTYLPADAVIEHGDLSGKGGIMHDADQIEVTDAGGYFTGTSVEAALQELGAGSTPASVSPAPVTAQLSNPPTEAEVESAIGELPSDVAGTSYLLTDSDSGQTYLVVSDGVRFVVVPLVTPPTDTDPLSLTAAPSGGWSNNGRVNATYYNGKTYIAYTDGTNGNKCIRSYDHATGTISAETVLKAALSDDPVHSEPTVVVRSSDHRLVVIYSASGGSALYQRISTNPEDISAFAAETNLDSQLGGTAYTYPHLIELSDALYLFVQMSGSGSVGQDWGYAISTDGGATWGALTEFFTEAANLGYIAASKTSESRVDFTAVSIPSGGSPPTSLYHAYLTSGSFHATDGTLISASLPFGVSAMTVAYDATADNALSSVVPVVLRDGRPVILNAAVFPDTSIRMLYHSWDGSAWGTVELCDDADDATAGGGAGGRLVGPNLAYISRNVAGVNQIFRFLTLDDGTTWTSEQITSGSAQKVRPIPVIDAAPELRVLWLEGDSSAPPDFSCGIAGFGNGDAAASAAEHLTRIISIDGDKADLEALAGPRTEVLVGVADDTGEIGVYKDGAWHWSGGASLSRWIVDPGAPSYSGTGPVTVTLTSKFGIDSSGNPYYNSANVTDGEEAALGWDSDTETYFLRPYYP